MYKGNPEKNEMNGRSFGRGQGVVRLTGSTRWNVLAETSKQINLNEKNESQSKNPAGKSDIISLWTTPKVVPQKSFNVRQVIEDQRDLERKMNITKEKCLSADKDPKQQQQQVEMKTTFIPLVPDEESKKEQTVPDQMEKTKKGVTTPQMPIMWAEDIVRDLGQIANHESKITFMDPPGPPGLVNGNWEKKKCIPKTKKFNVNLARRLKDEREKKIEAYLDSFPKQTRKERIEVWFREQ